MAGKRKNRLGHRFGRLVIIATAESADPDQPRWLCRCDCGTEKSIQSGNLISGNIRSCGCLVVEMRKAAGTHKQSRGSPTYRSWISMKQRCYNENHTNYPRYGGRGITVCERWRASFENFLTDMGPRPSLTHSLERTDNNGNYVPDNVVWATSDVQASNRSTQRVIDINGTKMSVTEAARQFNIPRGRLFGRLRRGWAVDRAISEPFTDGA